MRSLWATLGKHGLAPMVWSEADSPRSRFVDSAVLNDSRFNYLRLCDEQLEAPVLDLEKLPVVGRKSSYLRRSSKTKKEALDNKNLFKIIEPDQ